MPEQTAADPSSLPSRLIFALPGSALIGVAFLVPCESMVALASPWLSWLYLIPLGIAYWLLRTRTVVDRETLIVRRAFSRKALNWSDIASLRVREGKWIRAVRADGSELVLPMVRPRHLSALALISGGRLADPAAKQDVVEPAPADAVPDAE